MERLPLLAMEALCQYLSAADLTACSAVSRGWRAVFNEDGLWRPHCEPDLEEMLRTTPPTVRQNSTARVFDWEELRRSLQIDTCTQSSSTSTETEVTVLEKSTSLEPLCQWRQAHIRQNCLLNNWKHVRFSRSKVTLDCRCEPWYHKAEFITDDLIFVTCRRKAEITLWNVKSNPPVKCGGTSYRHLSDVWDHRQTYVDQSRTQGYMYCYRENQNIRVQHLDRAMNSVDVYHFDLNAITLELCYIFTSQEFKSECEGAANPSDIIVCEKLIHKCCVAEHMFLVAFVETPGASEIHIWNLQTGEHIKTVPLPPNEYFHKFGVAGQDVLVVTVYRKDDEVDFYGGREVGGYLYHIYNVKQLAFLSFTAGRVLLAREPPYCDKFGMVENYLIIRSLSTVRPIGYTFQIFNYKTNELLQEGPLSTDFMEDGDMRGLDDGFIFLGRAYRPFVFDPRDETILPLVECDCWDLDDLLEKIFDNSIRKIFFFKHVLFSNVSKKTINDLFQVTKILEMNPSSLVGVSVSYTRHVLSIIRFW